VAVSGIGRARYAISPCGQIASAKRFPRLLAFRSAYELAPTRESRGRARIEAPDGRSMSTDDPEASAIISETLSCELRLESQPRADEKTCIDRRTVFGDVPVSQMRPGWTRETMPDYFQLKSDSFFEIGAVFVLTSGSADFAPTLWCVTLDTGPGGASTRLERVADRRSSARRLPRRDASVRSPGRVSGGDPVHLL
jgi:hypothetical protein